MKTQPYKINVAQSVLDDLQKRLKRTRWPDEEDGIGWNHGTNLAYMKDITNYWINEYSWRKEEEKLNGFSWFTAKINGKLVQFIHEKGKGPNPTPLILFHGWPDSVMRYLKLLPMLTYPEKHGGSHDESFDVIIPSYVGGFDETAQRPSQHEIKDLAEICWQLMTKVLGYNKFFAAGGDGGSPISQIIARDHPDAIIGLHLTDIGWHALRRDKSGLTEKEQQFLQNQEYFGFQEGAYAMVQGTKPQALALGLNDSPVGMAAWIIEKFRSWSDCKGDIGNLFTKDELITNIMFYWLKSSVRSFSYKEEFMSLSIQPDQEIKVPVALAFPPKDLGGAAPPHELVARNLKSIKHWNVLDNGGHFVAMEFPELFAKDMRATLKTFI